MKYLLIILALALVSFTGCESLPVAQESTQTFTTSSDSTQAQIVAPNRVVLSWENKTPIKRTLKVGSYNPDVRIFQKHVGATQDGKFGPATEKLAKAFQSKNGLKADGVIGSAGWKKILPIDPTRPGTSDLIVKHMTANLATYSKAKDITTFCPKFKTVSDDVKVKALSELILGIYIPESAQNPTSYMIETTMSTDPVTKQQVKSEGYGQLSYQDVPNYGSLLKDCGIDWSKDKNKDLSDPTRTILDPNINTECTMRILKNQIANKGSITLSSGVYWAVLKIGGKYQKISQIAYHVKTNVPACN